MFRKHFSLVAIIVSLIFTVFIYLSFQISDGGPVGFSSVSNSIIVPEEDTAFGGIFSRPLVNDSLPHYRYKQLEDSLGRIKAGIQGNNNSFGSGTSFGAFNVTKIRKEGYTHFNSPGKLVLLILKDSLDVLDKKMTSLQPGDSLDRLKQLADGVLERYHTQFNVLLRQTGKESENYYYFGLNGYTTDYDTKFFIDKETYNLAYVVWDSVYEKNAGTSALGHYERKRIPVRYSADEQRILIPVSKGQYRFLNGAIHVLTYVYIFLFVYFFIGLPLQIVINVSKGKAFTLKNIRRFNLMVIVMLAYIVLSITTPYFFRWFFRNKIADEFSLPSFWSASLHYFDLLLVALGLFIVGKAFQRGYKLQQENALTI